MSEESEQTTAGKWLGYREEIKVIDVTIRDGGLMNDHKFSDKVVKAVYDACVASGIDYMEIGYKNSKAQFPPSENGPWKHSDEEDIRRIVGENDTSLKLSAMADAEKSEKEDVIPKSESVLDMIRVATYIHQLPTALDMIKDAHDKGYETTCNLMAISTVSDSEIDQALEELVQTPVGTIVVVDSFGNLYHEQIRGLVRKYKKAMEGTGKEVGIHTHNNQQLAFSNTVEALIRGATMLDASLAGLGRGAGNCAMELLVGFLHNPKFRLRPLLECIQQHIEPMRSELLWGYDVSYMITGMLNQRYDEERQKADAPFLGAYTSKSAYVRASEFFMLGAEVSDNGWLRGMTAVLAEAARVRRFGFTAGELERRKAEMMSGIERAYAERNSTESRAFVRRCIRHFNRGVISVGVEDRLELYKQLLPTIELTHVNGLAAELERVTGAEVCHPTNQCCHPPPTLEEPKSYPPPGFYIWF